MSRPSSHSLQVFPFLAVLVCTMGALILLLLVTVYKMRQVAVARAIAAQDAALASSAPPQVSGPELRPSRPTPEDLTKLETARQARRAEREARRRANAAASQRQANREAQWQRELAAAEIARDQRRQSLTAAQGELDGLRQRLQVTETNLQKLVDKKSKVKTLEARDAQSLTQTELEHQKLSDDITTAQKKLADIKRSHTDAASKFAFIPYDGASGTTRRPIYIECTNIGIRFQPENELLDENDLKGFTETYNPLLLASEKLMQYWREHAGPATGREDVKKPYVLLVVRPSGTVSYYVARKMLSKLADDFGYELVEDDFPLQLPPAEPEAKVTIQRAVAEALRNRGQTLALSERDSEPRLGPALSGRSDVAARKDEVIDFDSLDDRHEAAKSLEESPFAKNSPVSGKGFSVTRSPVREGEIARGGSSKPSTGHGPAGGGSGNLGSLDEHVSARETPLPGSLAEMTRGGPRTGSTTGPRMGGGPGVANGLGSTTGAGAGFGSGTASGFGTGARSGASSANASGLGTPIGSTTAPGFGDGARAGADSGTEFGVGGSSGTGSGFGTEAGSDLDIFSDLGTAGSPGAPDGTGTGSGSGTGPGGTPSSGLGSGSGAPNGSGTAALIPNTSGGRRDDSKTYALSDPFAPKHVATGDPDTAGDHTQGARGEHTAGDMAGHATGGNTGTSGGAGRRTAARGSSGGARGSQPGKVIDGSPDATPISEGGIEGAVAGNTNSATTAQQDGPGGDVDLEPGSPRGSPAGSGSRSAGRRPAGRNSFVRDSETTQPRTYGKPNTEDKKVSDATADSSSSDSGSQIQGGGSQRGGAQGRSSGPSVPQKRVYGDNPEARQELAAAARKSKASSSASTMQKRDSARRRWGGSNTGQIGFERQVSIQVLADKVLIGQNDIEVVIEPGTTPDELVESVLEALDEHSLSWGKPPTRFYWVPYVKFDVSPGGSANYERLHGALRDWGIFSESNFQTGSPPATQVAAKVEANSAAKKTTAQKKAPTTAKIQPGGAAAKSIGPPEAPGKSTETEQNPSGSQTERSWFRRIIPGVFK